MPRVILGSNWFEVIDSRTWYERDFESLIADRAEQIFPRWCCVPFTADVVGEDGTVKRPDLALIDEQYREWWVVEVELAHHSLAAHVMPQVEAFRTATYDSSHAIALVGRSPHLDAARLTEMMRGVPPGILVVVDTPSTKWGPSLQSIGVQLAIVEPFRDKGTQVLLRINGFQPDPPSEVLTRCSRNVRLRRLWRVDSPAALPSGVTLDIEFEGSIHRWHRVDLHDAVMLKASRGDILTDLSSVDLVLREDGSLAFRSGRKPKRGSNL